MFNKYPQSTPHSGDSVSFLRKADCFQRLRMRETVGKNSFVLYILQRKRLNCPISSNYTSVLPPGCDTMVVIHNSFLRI